MLINCTESPFQEWTAEMLSIVENKFGLIVNHSLPSVNENMIDEDIDLIAEENFDKIMTILDEKSDKSKPEAVFLLEYLPMHKRLLEYLNGSEVEGIDIDNFKEEEL